MLVYILSTKKLVFDTLTLYFCFQTIECTKLGSFIFFFLQVRFKLRASSSFQVWNSTKSWSPVWMWWSVEKKNITSQVLTSAYHPTWWTSHQQIPFFFPKWCKEMAAKPSGVSPLSLHLRLSTDSPLPLGRLTSSTTCGRPPYAQSNMLTGRNQRGENHFVKTPQRPAASVLSSFLHFLRPGDEKYPKS